MLNNSANYVDKTSNLWRHLKSKHNELLQNEKGNDGTLISKNINVFNY